MEVYEILKRPQEIQYEIRGKMAMREEYESMLYPSGIRYDLEKVQTSPRDRMPEIVAKLDFIDRFLAQLSREYADASDEAEKLISMLENPLSQMIFTMYYLGGVKIRDIAANQNYSIDGIYMILRRGRNEIVQRISRKPII